MTPPCPPLEGRSVFHVRIEPTLRSTEFSNRSKHSPHASATKYSIAKVLTGNMRATTISFEIKQNLIELSDTYSTIPSKLDSALIHFYVPLH